MKTAPAMDEALAEMIRRRAGGICEYCRLPEALHPAPFEIEHVIPRQHGGSTTPSNLAYACLHCNRHKGPNLAGIDQATSRTKLVRLFNPRRHKWGHHFRWDGPPSSDARPSAA
jgi:5-methylcytosine-specific restriction endonuclease McrA